MDQKKTKLLLPILLLSVIVLSACGSPAQTDQTTQPAQTTQTDQPDQPDQTTPTGYPVTDLPTGRTGGHTARPFSGFTQW